MPTGNVRLLASTARTGGATDEYARGLTKSVGVARWLRRTPDTLALSGYHQPWNMTSSVVWDLPVGRDRRFMTNTSAWADALLGGWQVAFISTVTAGDPVTFTYVPVAQAQVSGIGNAERNSVRGPNFWQVDFALQKAFRLPLGRNTQVQLRAEAFNLLNRTNFRAPVGNRSANNFGSITSTFDPRQLQLGVRLTF